MAESGGLGVLARRLGAARAWVVRAGLGEVLGQPGVDAVRPIAGEPVTCADLRALGAAARSGGRALVVDNTACGLVACAAVRLGAHLAAEGVGEGLVLVGLSRDAGRALPGVAEALDALPQAGEDEVAALVASLPARGAAWHVVSDTAQVVASYLACHPRVAEVCYPGLRADPSFEVAARTLTGGFGSHVSYRLADMGGWQGWEPSGTDARAEVMALEARLA